MSCVICKKGPHHGVSLHRINAKGGPGLWACRTHVGQTDASIDPEVAALVDALDPPKRPLP